MGNGNESGGGGGSPKKDPTREKIRKRQGKLNETQKDGLSIQQQVNKSIKEHETYLTGQYNALKDTIKATGEAIRKQVEYQAMIAAASLAVASFTGILKGANYVLNKFINISKTTIKTLTMMPILIGNFAASMGNQVRSELVETIGNATEGLKEFFDTASNGGGAVSNLGRIASGSLGAFQSVNSELTRLFGFGATGAAQMIQQLGQAINGMGVFAELFADSTTQSTKSIIYFQKMTKGLGMSAEDTKYITLEAAKNGEHYFDTMLRVKDASDSASKQFGINRKRLSIGFFDLRKDIVNFGHLSEPALMAVVGRATQLGVSMESLKGVFSKFDTFESAATSAAQLQQAFGMNIDALQLIRAEDPMQIVEMFRQSMLMTGRSFDDLNRHEKSLMASHTGMSAETLKSIMNYRTLGKSFEEIKKIMNDQKPEERHIRAMKDMNSSVTQVKKAIEGKGFFQNFADGVVASIKYNSDLGKSFVKVSARMERFYEHGLSLSRGQKKMLNDALRPLTKIVDSIIGPNGPFSKNVFKKFKTKVLSNTSEFVRDVFGDKSGKSKMAVRDAQKKWTNKLSNILNFKSLMSDQSFIGKIFRSSGEIIGVIIRGLTVAIPAITSALGDVFNEGLANIDDFFDSDTDMGNKLMKWLGYEDEEGRQIFDSITKGLDDLKKKFVGDGKQSGLFTRMFDSIQSIAKNAGKAFLQALLDNKGMLYDLIHFITFSLYDGVISLMMANKTLSTLFTDTAGGSFGVDQGAQEVESLGFETVLEKQAERLENFSFTNFNNDVAQIQNVMRELTVSEQAASKAVTEAGRLQMAYFNEGGNQVTLDGINALLAEQRRLRDLMGPAAGKQEVLQKLMDKEDIFKTGLGGVVSGSRGFRDDMYGLFGKDRVNKLVAEIFEGKSFDDAVGTKLGEAAEGDRIRLFNELLRQQNQLAAQAAGIVGKIEETIAYDSNSTVAKNKKLREALNQQALLTEAQTSDQLAATQATTTYQYDLEAFKRTGLGIGFTGSESALAQQQIKAAQADGGGRYVEKHNHPVLQRIADLAGKTGDDRQLTKEDFLLLQQLEGEKYDKLRQDFKQYLDDKDDRAVIVTIDGHAVTAHITKTMAEQQKLKPLGKGGPTIATPADPSRLKPAAGSPAPASGT